MKITYYINVMIHSFEYLYPNVTYTLVQRIPT